METYEEVGKGVGLDRNTLKRYVYYMRARWANEERQQCEDGYAEEWAFRFKNEIEFEKSDFAGKALLCKMEKEAL